MRILISEDEEILLTALEFRLKKYGFDVDVCENGREALEIIQTNPPDILITDIVMPEFTGLELLNHIRQKMHSDLPVIIITSIEDDEVVLDAFRLGADDFITKPFKPTELILRIRRIAETLQTRIAS